MKKGIPVLDVIECLATPKTCPACAYKDVKAEGEPVIRVSCPRCHWFARYKIREVVPTP